MEPEQALPHWVRVDLRVMVMKEYSTLLKNWIHTTRCSLVSYPGYYFCEGGLLLHNRLVKSIIDW